MSGADQHMLEQRIDQFRGDIMSQLQCVYQKWGWDVDEIRELDLSEFQFRVACKMEELSEYAAATTHADRLDALVDLHVFVVGTAIRHGYSGVWRDAVIRVLKANSRKVAGAVKNQRGESTFDLGKPEGWQAPDLRDLVGECDDPIFASRAAIPDDRRDVSRAAHKAALAMTKDEEIKLLRARLKDRDTRIVGLKQTVDRHDATIHDLRTRLNRGGQVRVDLEAEVERIKAEGRGVAELMGVHVTELRDQLSAIPPVFREAAALCTRKCEDYGQWDLSKREYHPFGHTSYLQMLHTKLTRLRSVAEQESTNFESARDSVIDLINYAGFYAAWMDEESNDGQAPNGEQG